MNTSILRQYEAIAAISRRMLDMARADDWERVVELGKTYRHEVERLRGIDDLDRDDRTTRRALLVRILDDDANIRKLASPELHRLERLLGDMKRQRDVVRAYCGWSTRRQ